VSEKAIFVIIATIVFIFLCGLGVGRLAFGSGERGVISDSGRDREFSREVGEIRSVIGVVRDGLDALQGNVGRVKVELGSVGTDLRELAVRLRTAGEIVREMEGEIIYLRRCIDNFGFIDGSVSGDDGDNE
jgi:hypothetical protein